MLKTSLNVLKTLVKRLQNAFWDNVFPVLRVLQNVLKTSLQDFIEDDLFIKCQRLFKTGI